MPCDTCGHTIQSLGSDRWYCPRCGSLTEINGNYRRTETPTIVVRARHVIVDPATIETAAIRNLESCCVRPEERMYSGGQ